MAKTLEFIIDFASPNAYLANQAIRPLLARTGATLRYTPALLGGIFKATNNRAPMLQYADIPAKLDYERLELMRFVAAHNLAKFQMNPHFPVNTLSLMRVAMVAAADGVLDQFVQMGMKAMWEDGENMAAPETLAAVLDAGGFDASGMILRLQDQAMKDALAASTAEAVARGVFGIPTFFVGAEMFFGKERLGQVEAALNA